MKGRIDFLTNLLIAALALGMLTACVPSKPKRPAIYDPSANAHEQIAQALAAGKREGKRVLLQFGANWCPDCQAMHKLFHNHPEIAAALRAHYVLVMVNTDNSDGPRRNADIVAKYGNPIEKGIPALVILDSNGAQLTTKNNNPLNDKDHRNPDKVLAFLQKWRAGSSPHPVP
jgi:thiol:disulfide interchange protein